MTITIVKKTTTSEEVEVIIPSFFRDKQEETYLGILDNNTVVRLFILRDYISMRNQTIESGTSDIQEAYEKFHSCTETEFFEAYDKAIHAITLHPKLSI